MSFPPPFFLLTAASLVLIAGFDKSKEKSAARKEDSKCFKDAQNVALWQVWVSHLSFRFPFGFKMQWNRTWAVSLLFVEIREQLRGPSFRGNCLLRLCPDFVGDPFLFFFSPVNKSQEVHKPRMSSVWRGYRGNKLWAL